MGRSSTSSGGIGLGGLLAVVFITLKLTNMIDWSWWWVLAPLWMPIALAVVILLIVAAFATAAENTRAKKDGW